MFWIPIMFIVGIFYLIYYCSQGAKTASFQREYNQYRLAKDKLLTVTKDSHLESDLDYMLDLKIEEWKTTVREFMNGGPEWEDYTDYASGKLKAKMIIMAKQGKLPSWLITFGEDLPLDDETRLKPGPHQIRPERGIEMNEQFILRLESFLRNQKNIPARAYVWTNIGSSPTIHMSLREFIDKYGHGKTHYFTTFQFVYEE